MEKSILLHCISPEELQQIIKDVIKEEFIDFKKNLDIKESDVLLTRSETCEFLKIAADKNYPRSKEISSKLCK